MKKVIASSRIQPDLLTFLSSELKVNGPMYRGARMPEFNPAQINESEFNDNLRMKSFKCSIFGDNLEIDWTTQEPFTPSEARELVDEIERAVEYLYQKWLDVSVSISNMPKVTVNVQDRCDSSSYSTYFGNCNSRYQTMRRHNNE